MVESSPLISGEATSLSFYILLLNLLSEIDLSLLCSLPTQDETFASRLGQFAEVSGKESKDFVGSSRQPARTNLL